MVFTWSDWQLSCARHTSLLLLFGFGSTVDRAPNLMLYESSLDDVGTGLDDMFPTTGRVRMMRNPRESNNCQCIGNYLHIHFFLSMLVT